jgi:hypothetical protein
LKLVICARPEPPRAGLLIFIVIEVRRSGCRKSLSACAGRMAPAPCVTAVIVSGLYQQWPRVFELCIFV